MQMDFPTLRTERLILRKVIDTDQDDMLQYLSDEEVMRHYGMPPFQSAQDALDEIRWYDQLFQAQTGIRWGIALAGDNRLIGSCGFHGWDKRHHRVEVGFELAKEHWGLGIMSEALRAALHYGFRSFPFNRIQAVVEPRNTASITLLKRLGFSAEGLLREYEYGCGRYDDLLMFSQLRREYKSE